MIARKEVRKFPRRIDRLKIMAPGCSSNGRFVDRKG
jgi:hypothetical protein